MNPITARWPGAGNRPEEMAALRAVPLTTNITLTIRGCDLARGHHLLRRRPSRRDYGRQPGTAGSINRPVIDYAQPMGRGYGLQPTPTTNDPVGRTGNDVRWALVTVVNGSGPADAVVGAASSRA